MYSKALRCDSGNYHCCCCCFLKILPEVLVRFYPPQTMMSLSVVIEGGGVRRNGDSECQKE